MTTARFSASVTLMARALAFEARFEALRRVGFEGAEIQLIGEASPDRIAHAAHATGLQIALLNVDMGDLPEGGPGLSGVPGREDEFRRRFQEAADTASWLGASTLHLAPSRVPAGVARETCWDCYVANVAYAASAARGAPFQIVIEPSNALDAPDMLLNDLDLAADLARSEGIGLLLDAYHMEKMGWDPADSYRRHEALVRHVQVSDPPRRGRPGTGRLDFDRFFGTLGRAGYNGWIGAEYAAETVGAADEGWVRVAKRQLEPAAAA